MSDDVLDVRTTIERLTDCAQRAKTSDLGTLAQMHGLCETLAEAARSDSGDDQPNAALVEAAGAIAGDLGALILGEADDPDATLAGIVSAVSGLAEPGSDASPAPTDTAEATESAGQPPKDVEAEVVGETTEPASADSGEPPYEAEPLIIAEQELEFIKGFAEEGSEHIEGIETAVLGVEQSPGNADRIDDLFRPFHTIKGMAGFLNLRDVNSLTHEVETLLDQGRKGERKITPAVIDIIFEVVDLLKIQIAEIADYAASPTGEQVAQPPVAPMINKLRAIICGRLAVEESASDLAFASGGERVGDILVAQGAVAESAVEWAAKQGRAEDKKIGQVLIEGGLASPKQVSKAIRQQKQAVPAAERTSVGDQSVRIDTSKLDALVDMVGELVIAETLVEANPVVASDPKLNKDVAQVAKIVRDVQETAMAMRMIPIGPTFQRMARVIRDVSRKAGKKVELTISGEDTELDKNVTQQIGDPLVHMVRNAVDHGVELPEDRVAAGKEETGHIHLNACHQGGNIIIQVRDDGKGLDREQLFAKAVERGIVQPDDEMTDEQVYGLIFAAGFSTAAEVTDISGRGVGMDVVRRNIEQLRGRTEITSTKGRGSTFSICLPLTLAIIDGMVVRVGNERFIIQTITIERALRPTTAQISTVQKQGAVLNVRGQLIPLIQLGEMFGFSDYVDPCSAMVVVAHCEGRLIGLVVEELIGQQQVVIKTLGERFENLRGISGAAILGDGRAGLILEMSGIAETHSGWSSPTGACGPAASTEASESAQLETALAT